MSDDSKMAAAARICARLGCGEPVRPRQVFHNTTCRKRAEGTERRRNQKRRSWRWQIDTELAEIWGIVTLRVVAEVFREGQERARIDRHIPR